MLQLLTRRFPHVTQDSCFGVPGQPHRHDLTICSPCPFHLLSIVCSYLFSRSLRPSLTRLSLLKIRFLSDLSLFCPRPSIEVGAWQAFDKHLLNESTNVAIPGTRQNSFLCVVVFSFLSLFKIRLREKERNVNYYLILTLVH